MAFGAWLMLILLGGSFFTGLWFLLTRKDDRLNRTRTLEPDNLKSRGSPDFSKARSEFDRKLAEVNRYLASKRLSEEEERALDEEAARAAEEKEARKKAEEEAKRLAELEKEEARKQAEYEVERAAELEEARKLAEQRELERQAEEARLAAVRESHRQQEMAEAETIRVAEIEKQKAAEELAAQEASDAAMKELRERLEREGAKSSDVQISLIWNNYNDLDLHVVCPSGERIHGGNRTSQCSGELDVDANVRPETKKPVENVVWPEGKAPGGTYRAYVHHYKKHKKRRAKDPTSFKVICNSGGVVKEYEGALSHGDPILLVCEFAVEAPEVRAKKAKEAKEKLEALERGELDADEVLEEISHFDEEEEKVVEENEEETETVEDEKTDDESETAEESTDEETEELVAEEPDVTELTLDTPATEEDSGDDDDDDDLLSTLMSDDD